MKRPIAILMLAVFGCNQRGEVLEPATQQPDAGVLRRAQDISSGERHTCSIVDNALYCWGTNDRGQLGTGNYTTAALPQAVFGSGNRWVQVASGSDHSCALDGIGRVHCWGENGRGQLGQGDRLARNVPTPVTLPERAASVATRFNHSCAVLLNAQLYCWGQNDEGELGQADTAPASDITAADGLLPLAVGAAEWRAVDAGDGHTCGIHLDGSLWCWGRNSEHELGPEVRTQVREPIAVSSGNAWLAVAAGQNHSCAIRSDASLWCWGQNTGNTSDDGFPLGLANSSQVATPTEVGTAADWVAVRTNTFHTCALNRAAELWCWGRNIEGQLGLGDLVSRDQPTFVAGDVATVSVGRFTTCAVATSGQPLCAGENQDAQLGTGDLLRRRRFTPVALP